MKLLPRLHRHEVHIATTALKERTASPLNAQAVIQELGLHPHWHRAGGGRVTTSERDQLAGQLRLLASQCGFPERRSLADQQNFDRGACRLLQQARFLLRPARKPSGMIVGQVSWFLISQTWSYGATGIMEIGSGEATEISCGGFGSETACCFWIRRKCLF
jgi:hypothetical protein